MLTNNKTVENEIYEHGFHVIDNFLESNDYHALRATAELMYSQGQFRSAKIGHQLDATYDQNIRNDKIFWVDEDTSNPSITAYFTKINAIAKILNQSLFLGLVDFETHFAIYQPGSFYKKHVDQFADTQERRISCVYYLNDQWQESFAGQLKLYDRNNQLMASILPLGNRLVCFSSDLPHEVCETKKIRYSITGWIKTRAMSLIS